MEYTESRGRDRIDGQKMIDGSWKWRQTIRGGKWTFGIVGRYNELYSRIYYTILEYICVTKLKKVKETLTGGGQGLSRAVVPKVYINVSCVFF